MSPMFLPQKIAIHHSASPRSTSFKQLQSWHTDPKPAGRGWSAIGYNTVIDGRGRAHVGRPIPQRGAGVARANTGLINICVTGNNAASRHQWTQRQVDALREHVEAYCLTWPHLRGQVYGHKDLALPGHATLCPGLDIDELIVREWQIEAYWRNDL